MSDTNRPDTDSGDAAEIDADEKAPVAGATAGAGSAAEDSDAASKLKAAVSDAADGDDALDKVVKLIDDLNAENAALKDRLIRSAAELDNVRKRGEREKQDVSRYAITRFSKDIIEVADTFERALAASPGEAATADKSVGDFVEGVAMTERLLLTVLERHGIRRVEAKAQKFDPNVHQAVTELPNPDIPDGHVAEVFQTGYLIEDRVLRPAMVAVARGGAKMAKPAEAAAAPVAANDDVAAERPGTDEASG